MVFFEWIMDSLLRFLFFSILALCLICWPLMYYGTMGEISEFKSISHTLERARNNKTVSPYEIAAIQQKVVDANRWLASNQYWNDTIVGWYIPDEVDTLKPIE